MAQTSEPKVQVRASTRSGKQIPGQASKYQVRETHIRSGKQVSGQASKYQVMQASIGSHLYHLKQEAQHLLNAEFLQPSDCQ